jgi:hypothetical protein
MDSSTRTVSLLEFRDPSRLIVGKTGVVSGVVQQPLSLTQFSFEHGCSLNLKILKAQ